MLIILFVISIFNVLNSEIIKSSQVFTLMTRIFIDLFFLIMISIIKIIIIINNNTNNSSYKLFKNNNVHYLRFVGFYKLLTKTQTNLLSKINLINKTQTLIIMTIKIH